MMNIAFNSTSPLAWSGNPRDAQWMHSAGYKSIRAGDSLSRSFTATSFATEENDSKRWCPADVENAHSREHVTTSSEGLPVLQEMNVGAPDGSQFTGQRSPDTGNPDGKRIQRNRTAFTQEQLELLEDGE